MMRFTPQKWRDKPPLDDLPPPVLEDGQPVYYRVACWMGFHDFELIEVQLSFVPGCSVEKVKCQHCGIVMLQTNS